MSPRLKWGEGSQEVRVPGKGIREKWQGAAPDVQVQQDLFFALTSVNLDSKDAQWL